MEGEDVKNIFEALKAIGFKADQIYLEKKLLKDDEYTGAYIIRTKKEEQEK